MKHIALTLFSCYFYLASTAQCSMVEIPLHQRAAAANLIVEGEVTAKNSFWNTSHTKIYTSNTIEVYKIFKGELTTSSIEVLTEGGIVGDFKILVEPSLSLNVGDVGVFTCATVTRFRDLPPSRSAIPQYEAYASEQGFVRYDLNNQTAADVFRTYTDITNDVYKVVLDPTKRNYRTVSQFDFSGARIGPQTQSVTISNFSPTTITGGTASVLTINGSGFGASQGSGTVGFKNADDGGATYINPLATQYLTWSNTQITVQVPSNAGTGTIEVTQGTTTVSAGTLTVSYALQNVDFDPGSGTQAYSTDHVNDNGSGGYTWRMNPGFDGDALARASFMRAFDSWRCSTGINWTIGATTSVNDAVSDGTNVICYDNTAPLPSGVLGVCYSYWSGCASGPTIVWYVNELDIIFDDGSNISPLTWNFGPGLPTINQYDFESVAVHELGHGHQLAHVFNNGAIMHYALTNGASNRTPGVNDLAGANNVQARSLVANVCGPGAMTSYSCGSPPVAAFTGSPTTVCAGGSVAFTDQSTNTPTSWSWTFTGGTPGTSTSQNPTITYNTPGTYAVSLTATNSSGSDNQTTAGYITVNANPSGSGVVTNISCNGGNNGAINLTPSGGLGPYTFVWNPSGQTTEDRNSLTAATYSVTITDAHGCTFQTSFPVTQPTALTATQSHTNVTCNASCNGTASVVASGGTAGYTYAWTPSGGTGSSASSLCAGTYTCTITDANGCLITKTFIITQPSALTATQSQTNVTCNGSCNGTATVVPSGGTPGYTYSWAPSGGTAATASSLCPSNYTCTITDANGCSITKTFTITQPSAITVTPTSQTNLSCNGGSNGTASVTASGGTGSLSYNWTPGNPTGDGTNSVTGLTAGTWTCTVTDANGCTNNTATFNITQPTAITSSVSSQTNISCNGGGNGSATVSASGGTPSYTYSWAPSGGNAATASGLTAGTYTCTITDSNGCIKTQTVTITQPSVLSASSSSTPESCSNGNGTATATPSGGTPAYTYSWAPTGGTAATASSLTAGNYTCTVTDANGCTTTTSVTVSSSAALSATITSSTNISCNGGSDGSATAAPVGGTAPFAFSWTPSGGTAATASGLSNGTYTCTITDSGGCTGSATVTITQPSVLSVSMSEVDASCANNDGTATATPSGGTSPYAYSWNPSAQTTQTATALSGATYTCTVTDNNGCTTAGNTTVNTLTCAGPGHLTAASCGITLGTLNQAINCVTVAGATNYRYKFMQGATTIAIYTRGNNLTNCVLSNISTIRYAQTYQVTVAALVSNVWTSYGSSCNVTTPAFPPGQVSAGSCGLTLATMNTTLNCNSIVGATDYQWKFMQGATTISTYTRGTSIADCNLINVSNLQYGQMYDVYVRGKVGGVFGPYGTSCTVTTPTSIPPTEVAGLYCGANLTNISSGIFCDAVQGATNYQWNIQNGAYSSTLNRGTGQTDWRLSYHPGVQANTTYTVTVRAYVGGVWGTFGPACTVHTGPSSLAPNNLGNEVPSVIRMANPDVFGWDNELSINVYPNPSSDGNVLIEFTNPPDNSSEVTLELYDSFGRKLLSEKRTYTAGESVALKPGEISNGIYLLKATIGGSTVMQKIIVQ
jgi:PKD repeat protein